MYWREWLKTMVWALIILGMLNMWVFNISTVKGQSMQPTLVQQERLFINKFIYKFHPPARGDVIILHDPVLSAQPTSKLLVKRVIAIGGDRIEIRNHEVYINQIKQQEPYIDTVIGDVDLAPIIVPEGQYYVMGDNRHQGMSKDSRIFGTISLKQIVGRADFIIWPLSKTALL
ncbi:signal peptidase I [Paenibacillus sp. PsM32]|uniref:signal peptidase I n=1 Tax=Paenibacillus sp. PsM32 TaxID=3030536 RepID=UPI00263A884D|nr:signal peptidase I [Paenibacillus sp. PsM32]MDN4619341.1 signal peptidase I [Paenibacillus sp. PsM32]